MLHQPAYAGRSPREGAMMGRTTTLGLIQMRCDGPREQNLAKAVRLVGEAAAKGAKLVVLPELFLGPYFCQRPDDRVAFDLAEPVPGPTTEALARAAAENRVVLVGGSVFERAADGRFFNTAPVLDEKGTLLG